MLPEFGYLTNTNADSVMIDGKRNLGCGHNTVLLFMKDRKKVKEGMN